MRNAVNHVAALQPARTLIRNKAKEERHWQHDAGQIEPDVSAFQSLRTSSD